MKKIIFLLATVFLVGKLLSQNLIDNPSFEIPADANDNCPSDFAQFDKLANWQSRTKIVSSFTSSGGTSALHSPDWLKVACTNSDPLGHSVTPLTGNSDAFVTPEELAEQNLSGALNEGIYIFKANVKVFSNNINSAYSYYFRLRLAYNEMTFASENSDEDAYNCSSDYRNLSGQNMITYLIPIQIGSSYLNTWQEVSKEDIKIFKFGYDWLGFDVVVYDGNGNERICELAGIQVDDLSLYKDCCGDYILYQNANSSTIPDLTQRRKYIRAGYDVGAPNQPPGYVNIDAGRHIKFRAGDFIDIEPGKNMGLGAVLDQEIAPCGSESDPNFDFDISFDYANQCAYLDCGEPYYPPQPNNCFGTNAAIYSNGGGWYWVIIKNSSGSIIFEDIQPINGLITEYWNGSGSAAFTALQGQSEVDMGIYNCENREIRSYTLTYHYVNGCLPTDKKQADDISIKDTLDNKEFSLKIFPNPTTGFLYLKSENIDYSNVEIEILNNMSERIKIQAEANTIDISQFSSGLYFLSVHIKNQIPIIFKIVKL